MSSKWLALLTLMAPFTALLLALWALSMQRFEKDLGPRIRLLGWATRLLSAFSLASSILLATRSAEFPFNFSVGIAFYLDALSIYFVLLVNLVAFFASWYSANFLGHDAKYGEHHEPELFHFFFNAFHLTMLIVPMVDSLVFLWMAVELTTLASTLLVRYRRQRKTLEAAWKYIITTTAGIVFALFGTIFLAEAIPQDLGVSIGFMRWSVLGRPEVAKALDQTLVVLAFLFVLVGYGTKAGFAPMHTWLPDGHGEAPSAVSALLSGVLLKSALYAILRFYTITNLNLGDVSFTSTVLLLSGLFSLVLATPFILKRNKFKRILAYHSLEHMGIITFGIGIGGVALFGALLHALNHALTKALMFLTFSNVRREYISRDPASELDDEERYTGILRSMPLTGVVLTLGGVGLVGSPPFNIFFSELIILWGTFDRIIHPSSESGSLQTVFYIAAIVLFLLTVTLIFGGLVGHLGRLLLDRPPYEGMQERLRELVPLFVLLGIVTVFGFWIPTWPVDFPQLLNQSVCILENGSVPTCP